MARADAGPRIPDMPPSWKVECSECGTFIDAVDLAQVLVRLGDHLRMHELLEDFLQPASELLADET